MLINFTVENWLSFRDETTFSMVAGRERQHGERLPRVKKYQMRLLPVAAVYGGNASGKSNFYKAMRFAQKFITKGPKSDSRISLEYFRLDPEYKDKAVRFSFELLIDEIIYKYAFVLSDQVVFDESLSRMTSSSEIDLFIRDEEGISFPDSLSEKETTRLEIIFEGTRANQLFLTNSVSQRLEMFKPVFDWFDSTLQLIDPEKQFAFGVDLDLSAQLCAELSSVLPGLDTGISKLHEELIPLEKDPSMKSFPPYILEKITDDSPLTFEEPFGGGSVTIVRRDGELFTHRLVTYHQQHDGESIKFKMRDESDGSKRAISLLPAFLVLASNNEDCVFFIDELDRSLHTLLSRQLLEYYLASCGPEKRSQLVFTTHDLLLMDQELFRRDEMWLTERDCDGASTLFSFSDYEGVRYDKDLRKSYLLGRFGGIPSVYLPPAAKKGQENSAKHNHGKETCKETV